MTILAATVGDVAHLAAVAVAEPLWLLATVRISLVVARMYQIEEYEAPRLWAWANVRAWNWHRALVVASLVALVLGAVAILRDTAEWAAYEALAGAAVLNLLWRWIPPKKALVWTPRMRRLFAATVVILGALALVQTVILVTSTALVAALFVWLCVFAATSLAVVAIIVANLLMMPVEARIRGGFLLAARRRLSSVGPEVIAVTGSWGKTSTKHILAHLLPESAAALATPKSFNTLMGVSRTINDDLEDSQRTFIVEMDAYAAGEITAICDLVHPRLAIVTAVGAQHLERFASVDAIADALYECVAALPAQGSAVVYAGDPRCAALATRARGEGRRVVTYAAEAENKDADVIASAVEAYAGGSRFTWRWPAENLAIEVQVALLGKHQVLNVSAALAAVHLLGHDVAAAAPRAASLEPVEHRLQPVPGGNGVTIIDDSYNANPVGVHNGLEVLASVGSGQKILVTPGLVELGSEEAAENRAYGEHAARVCNHVIVVRAKTSQALIEGLREGGIATEGLHIVASLDEATAVIARIARRGDTVLFANDLPDTYL